MRKMFFLVMIAGWLGSGAAFGQDAAAQKLIGRLPSGEQARLLFNGKDLTGWQGDARFWSVSEGMIRGANQDAVPSSTYLFTESSYRNFRLLFEVRQTMSPQHSTMHSAVAILGERIPDAGDNAFGFKGPLVMFCHDWGIWDAHGRSRVVPVGEGPRVEKKGDWNLIEVLVTGNRIRCVANGTLVFDFTDKPEFLKASPIGLQLHSEKRPQEYHFRGLVLAENPQDQLVTLAQPERFTQVPEVAPSTTIEGTGPSPAPKKDLFAAGPKPHWIWGPENDGKYTIGTTFTVKNPKRVVVKATSDNVMTLKVNDKTVAASDEWQSPVEKDITGVLKDGENVIHADVDNQGGAAAFLAKVAIERADGTVDYLVSGTDWRAVRRDNKTEVALRDLGELGVGPWNNVFDAVNDAGVPRDTFVLLPGFQVEKLFTSDRGGLTVYQFEPGGRYAYYYAHLQSYAAGLHEAQRIRQGEVIGYVGSTGNASASAPHLHFAIFLLGPEKRWWEGTAINPYPLLRASAP